MQTTAPRASRPTFTLPSPSLSGLPPELSLSFGSHVRPQIFLASTLSSAHTWRKVPVSQVLALSAWLLVSYFIKALACSFRVKNSATEEHIKMENSLCCDFIMSFSLNIKNKAISLKGTLRNHSVLPWRSSRPSIQWHTTVFSLKVLGLQKWFHV